MDKKKEALSKVKGKDKKADRYEESLKTANRDMAMTKFKSTFAVGFLLISLFAFLNSRYASSQAKTIFLGFSKLKIY